jgi:hypothetical protein
MPDREEILVSAVPLTVRIERGHGGELQILVDGFDPIELAHAQRIIVRPEGHGVVIERET